MSKGTGKAQALALEQVPCIEDMDGENSTFHGGVDALNRRAVVSMDGEAMPNSSAFPKLNPCMTFVIPITGGSPFLTNSYCPGECFSSC